MGVGSVLARGGEAAVNYVKTVGKVAHTLVVKPTQVVWKGAHDSVVSPAAKYIAGVGVAAAGAVGYKSWSDKREARFAAEQNEKALPLEQNISGNHDMIAELARQRAAAIQSVARDDAPTNNAAKLEAAKQREATLSV
jgi:hypothetical protein